MKRSFAPLFALMVGLAVTPVSHAQTPSILNSTNSLSIRQWVRSEDGVVRGTVVAPKQDGALEAVSGVEVLVSRRDGLNLRVATDEQGRFTISEVEPGVYAMSVWQDKVLAACALQVVDASNDPESMYPSEALVSIADIDRPTIKTAIIRYLPAGVRTAPQFMSGIDFAALAAKVRPSGNTLRIAQSNGGLSGRLYLAGAEGSELQGAAMSNVFIVQDGNQIDRALTNERGEFVFETLAPGVYSMLAIGPGGVGLIGFELALPEAINQGASKDSDGFTRLVSAVQTAADELSMQLAPVPEAIEGMDVLMDEEMEVIGQDGVPLVIDETCEDCFVETIVDACCSPICGGGVLGGGGGGGGSVGGGGGGGGGGGLSGLGALIGIVALAATSNDDNVVVIPRPTSPASP